MKLLDRIKLIRFVLMLRRHENLDDTDFYTCHKINKYLRNNAFTSFANMDTILKYYIDLYPRETIDEWTAINYDMDDFVGHYLLRRKYLLKLAIHLALFKVG